MKKIYAKTLETLSTKLKRELEQLGAPLAGPVIADGSLHYVELDEDGLVLGHQEAWYWVDSTTLAMYGCFHMDATELMRSLSFMTIKQLGIFSLQYAGAKAYADHRRAACEYWIKWNEADSGDRPIS